MKRFTRSMVDRKFLGVCGGIAEYFEIDSALVRLLFVLFGLFGGSALFLYMACALLMRDGYGKRVD